VASEALWLGNAGKPLSRQIIAKRVSGYGRQAGIKGKKVSPHVWRHTFATSLIRGGAAVWHVQEFLGHDRTTSTTVYTRMLAVDIKKAHSAAYPEQIEGPMPKVQSITSGHY
jgi:integrase/recombinase XerD